MAITNGYLTLAEIKEVLNIEDVADDNLLERAVEGASRAIDNFTQRRFFLDAVDASRRFTAENLALVFIDDLTTLTQLATDEDGDGIFETVWDPTDFRLEPVESDLDGEPFTRIKKTVPSLLRFPLFEAGVEVTGKFGWPSVPTPIKQATSILTVRHFKRKDAPFGIAGASDDLGILRFSSPFDADVKALLLPFRQPRVG